jgi:predicted phosphodiesterase
MLELFIGLPLHFVFGNNEYDLAALRSKARATSVRCHEQVGELEFGGKRVALLHGHEHGTLQRLVRAGQHDYIIHGHTHVRRDERVKTAGGSTRLVNPGALHRARVKSVALLDVATDRLEFLELPEGGRPRGGIAPSL